MDLDMAWDNMRKIWRKRDIFRTALPEDSSDRQALVRNETIYVLHRGEEKLIPVQIRELKLDDMRVANQLEDFRTLQKVLQEIPGIQIWYGDFDELVEPLARRMYVDPDKLPLLIVTDPGMTAIYVCSGYNVGSVGLMLELLT